MFSDELEKISWEKTTEAIYSKTEADVLRALGKTRCDVEDFMALVSPAAQKYLEPMARLSRKYLMHELVRVLRIPHQQPDGAHHPHAGGNRKRIQGHQKTGSVRKLAHRDRRESGKGGRAVSGESARPGETLLLKLENRGDAAQNGRVCRIGETRNERSDLLSGNLQQGALQRLPPARHEVEVRMARERIRPHGAGRSAFHRHGRAHRAGSGWKTGART